MSFGSITVKFNIFMEWVKQIKTILTITYCASFMCLGLLQAGVGPSLPTIGFNTHSSDVRLGGSITARALGYLLGSASGPVFHKISGHKLVAVALIFTSAVCFALPYISNFYLLVVLFIGQGITMGMIDTGGNLMTLWTHKESCEPYMQALHASFAVGAVISPLILQSAIAHNMHISVAWTIFGLTFIPVIITLLCFESPGEPAAAAAAEELDKPVKISWRMDMKPHLLVLSISIFLLCYIGGEIATGSFLTTFALRRKLTDEAGGAFMTFMFWLFFACGRLLAIPLSLYMSPKLMMTIDLAGSLCSVIFIWVFASHYTGILVSLCFYGLFMASTFPTAITLLQTIVPVTGHMTTAFVIGASTGCMVIPLIVSNSFAATNYMSLIYAQFASTVGGIILMMIASGLAWVILRQRATSSQNTPDIEIQTIDAEISDNEPTVSIDLSDD
jgi:FHS family Na+ dependent glucose MFS transporter 1